MSRGIKIFFTNPKALFLENIGIKQTVLKNTFWLILAEVVIKILGLVSVIYIARVLGATEYGKFTFALSFVSVMIILSDLGITDISTREFSRKKENENKISSIFTLEIILCLLVLVITVISSFFITSDYSVRKMIWVLIIYILSNSLLGVVFSFLRARQKMEYEAIIKISQAVINTLAVFFVIFYIPSSQNLSYGYLISSLVVLFFILIFFSIFFQPLSLRWEKNSLHILKISWPLSVGFMGSWVYVLINSIMLGYFGLITENGWYSAALKIAIAVSIPADLVAKSFYPVLSKFFVDSKEKLQKTWDYIEEVMIIMAIPMVAGGIVVAPKIMDFFYGSSFAPSILAFQLLVVVMGISFLNYPYSIILVVADQQKKNFIFIFLGAIINIVLNFILIPIYGFYGAIVATIIALFIVLIVTIVFSKYKTPIIPLDKEILKTILISTLSSLVMYFVISHPFIYSFNVMVVCLLGVVTYVFSLLFLYKFIFPKKIIL